MRRCLLSLLLIAVGCDGAPALPDGGLPDADAPWTFAPPVEPQIPWLADGEPALAAPVAPNIACPTGWRARRHESAGDVCDPWPEAGMATCGDGEAHFPGETACARIGSACPADGWPVLAAGTSARHVDASATGVGADGSRALPYRRIADALAGAPASTVIALRLGTYDESVVLTAGISLVGACVTGSVLRPSAPSDDAAAIEASGAGAAVRNLRVSGERRGIQVTVAGASIEVEDVVVEGARNKALHAEGGGAITARSVLIVDTRGRPSDSLAGRAAQVQEGGSITVERGVFLRSRNAGAIAFDPGSVLTLRDVAVLDTLADESAVGIYGSGVSVDLGARIVIERVVIERARDHGLIAIGTNSLIEGTDVVVREMLGQEADGLFGDGASAEDGATITLSRALVDRARGFGVVARAGTITGSDVAIADVLETAGSGDSGVGAAARGGGTVTLERAIIGGSLRSGAYVRDTGVLTLRDAVVRGGRGDADGAAGLGLQVEAGGSAILERVEIADNRAAGIDVRGVGASATLTDVRVRGTRVQGVDPAIGVGIAVDAAGRLTATRLIVEDNTLINLTVLNGAEASIEDFVCRRVRPLAGMETLSQCAVVSGDTAAQLSLTRALIEEGSGLGVVAASSAGGTLELTDGVIRAIGPGVHGELLGGIGVFTSGAGIRATLRRVRVERAGLYGIAIGPQADVTLEDVRVADTALGDTVLDRAGGILAEVATLRATRVEVSGGQYGGLIMYAAAVTFDSVAVRGVASLALDGTFGRCVNVTDGTFEGRGLVLEGCREIGLGVFGESSRIEVADVEVRAIEPRACAETTCGESGGGVGVSMVEGASGRLERFILADNALTGLLLTRGGEIDLAHGEVRGNLIGVNVQSEGYDQNRLSNDVRFAENDLNVDAQELAVPTSSPRLLPD